MKKLLLANLVVLILLGLSAGAAKIMQAPQELKFFQDAGLSANLLIIFGVLQVAGGILLVFARTRKPGAVLLAATLGASAIMIFMNGMIAFGLFSLLPILMAGIVIIKPIGKNISTAGL
ncbi:MAG: DoxX family protein [Marinicaulis sp.]|nr:DoxX family protein [Marinicaulis sp.]